MEWNEKDNEFIIFPISFRTV